MTSAKRYKSKVKTYPDGARTVYVYKRPLDVCDTSEGDAGSYRDLTEDEIQAEYEHSKFMNLIRTKTKIRDYCLSNDFTYFWTLTFGGDNRHDDALCFSKLQKWLRWMKLKYGKFNYIFIPERHKDGAIHFHGVTGGFGGVIVDSGVKHKKAKVYNCSDWEHGFSTLTRIRSKKKCATYITKYVTKDLDQEIVGKGKKKYWCSRGLRLPAVEYSSFDLSFGKAPDFENETCYIYNFDS